MYRIFILQVINVPQPVQMAIMESKKTGFARIVKKVVQLVQESYIITVYLVMITIFSPHQMNAKV